MKATAELKMQPVSVLKPAAYNPRKKLKPGDKEYDEAARFYFAEFACVNFPRPGEQGCRRQVNESYEEAV